MKTTNINLSILHPYIRGRFTQINNGTYPKQHYWATDALLDATDIEACFVKNHTFKIPKLITKIINRKVLRGRSDLRNEIDAWNAAKSSDLIYSVCGPLSLSRFYKRCRLVSWVFQPPAVSCEFPLHPYNEENLRNHAGFLCLTPIAEKFFSQYAPSKFIPWCVDTDLFDGKPAVHKPKNAFFLASGKTGRDYKTLVKSAESVRAEVRIIGPKEQKPLSIPENLTWIDTSSDPPDQAIDYPTLREWYAQCIGVCIPLSGDANDTCGYTNMLEAMAMGKPVLMTQSGSLHIDPQIGEFGKLIEPQDSFGWAKGMNELLEDQTLAQRLGENGRRLAKKYFSIHRFNTEVLSFIRELDKKV